MKTSDRDPQYHPVLILWPNNSESRTRAGITGFTGFTDGKKTISDTNSAHQPTVGMHQTLQLDWFPAGSGTKPSEMQVDWVRVYDYK